jgi:hypothetical protein
MALSDLGSYKIELDAGFYQDVFTLDDDDLGILDEDFLDGSTTFFDVTQYVVNVQIKRGRTSQDAQFGAGTCTIIVDDLLGQDKFNVANTASPYWNTERGRLGFEPRRKVRISRNDQFLFNGLIQSYDTQFDLDNHNLVTITATDATINLTTTNITAFTPPAEKSGARVDRILGLPEIRYPTDPAPIIAEGVANLSSIEVSSQTPLAYFNALIESAEQGRLYIDRNGALVWEARTPKATTESPTIAFSDDGLATSITYQSLEVIYE